MTTTKQEKWALERDQLHSVPEAVDKLIATALGRRTEYILVVQTENGGHLFLNNSAINVPRTMEEIARIWRAGEGTHTTIGRKQ